jgi:hypothetical protein
MSEGVGLVPADPIADARPSKPYGPKANASKIRKLNKSYRFWSANLILKIAEPSATLAVNGLVLTQQPRAQD